MWLMLQQKKPDEYVLASGTTVSIKEFLDIVFMKLNLIADAHVVIDPAFLRPAEVHILCGNSDKARKELGWSPQYRHLEDLIDDMLAGE